MSKVCDRVTMYEVDQERFFQSLVDTICKSSILATLQAEQSAELKIAKVAVTNVLLWICIWSPYATVVIIGPFGNRDLITPLFSQCPSCAAKLASIFNPIMFALSHPK